MTREEAIADAIAAYIAAADAAYATYRADATAAAYIAEVERINKEDPK